MTTRVAAVCMAGTLCRLDDEVVQCIRTERHTARLAIACCLTVLGGCAAYGVAFGAWRAPIQAFYSAVKLPLMMLSVIALSGGINTLLAQALGSRMSFRQVFLSILVSLSIASAILGALSPVVLYLALQLPGPDDAHAMISYRLLLPAHTAAFAVTGIVGTVRLHSLLRAVTASPAVSMRVLISWLLVSGLVGCELSWVFSPFLARPDLPIPPLNPNAFSSNFFEYLWATVQGAL